MILDKYGGGDLEDRIRSLRDRPAALAGIGLVTMVLLVIGVLWISNEQDKTAADGPELEGYDLVMSEAQPNGGRMMLMKATDGQSTALVFISKGTSIGPGFTGQSQQQFGQGQTEPSTYGSYGAQSDGGLRSSSSHEDYDAPETPADETGQLSGIDDSMHD